MLDIKKIKENPDAVKAGLRAKEVDCDATVDRILELDGKIRALKTNTETQTAQKNKLAKENGKLFGMKKKAEKEGNDVSELDAAIAANNAQSVQIAEAIEQELTELKTLSDEYRVAMLSLPNLPDPDLKPGGKENNEPLRYFGEPHKFDFTPKHHVDLCEGLGLIDYDRGVKLAGSGFWMYKGMGARLEWALLNYFIDCHIADGYEFILPPHMLEYQCGETAGQFPKFADEVYKISNPTDDRVHYMLPTAEAALCSIYRDEILTEAELPRKFFAYTPCFRREAGSHRADERGAEQQPAQPHGEPAAPAASDGLSRDIVPGCLACLTQNVLLRDVTALTAHDEDRLLEKTLVRRIQHHHPPGNSFYHSITPPSACWFHFPAKMGGLYRFSEFFPPQTACSCKSGR